MRRSPGTRQRRVEGSEGLLCVGDETLIAVVGDPLPNLPVPQFSWPETDSLLLLIEGML